MALSNAERQRRYREKQKQTLRNAGNKTLAAAYGEWMREVAEMQDDISVDSIPGEVAQAVLDFESSTGGVFLDKDDDRMSVGDEALMGALGGVEYCRAVNAWKHDCREVEEYNKGRKKQNRKPYPTPPDVPVT